MQKLNFHGQYCTKSDPKKNVLASYLVSHNEIKRRKKDNILFATETKIKFGVFFEKLE